MAIVSDMVTGPTSYLSFHGSFTKGARAFVSSLSHFRFLRFCWRIFDVSATSPVSSFASYRRSGTWSVLFETGFIAMAQRTELKTTFEASQTIEPIYTGGSVALSADGTLLATSLGDDALVTHLPTGQRLARIEGVSSPSRATRMEKAEAG